ncbi:hypothetical protein AUJ65_03260 [Candidatus Micrarchaeota archaeon CG1_02_51_15]|nr:MAG: hypothetical protein AUJ65_03260 [Candidatus Micrarchaeota archaeon CG1_02_51_15]
MAKKDIAISGHTANQKALQKALKRLQKQNAPQRNRNSLATLALTGLAGLVAAGSIKIVDHAHDQQYDMANEAREGKRSSQIL